MAEATSPRPSTKQQPGSGRFMSLRTEPKKQATGPSSMTLSKTQGPPKKATRNQLHVSQDIWTSRGGKTDKTESQQMIMKKRDMLNMELMQLLEQETAAESIREQQLKQTSEEVERRRLDKIFGMDRAKASERIIATSDKHDNILR